MFTQGFFFRACNISYISITHTLLATCVYAFRHVLLTCPQPVLEKACIFFDPYLQAGGELGQAGFGGPKVLSPLCPSLISGRLAWL